MLVEVSRLLLQYWLVALLISCFGFLLRNKYGYGINKYPGPLLAGYTNWWRFFDVLGRQAQFTHIQLHRKLGSVVRLGPNVLSFSNPQAIKDIYGLNKGFTKTEFYPVQNNIAGGYRTKSLFSTTDEPFHARLRRNVNSAFAMSTLLSYEPLVDEATKVFLDQTQKRFCDTGAVCDFARWNQMYAFDVIGQMTFSKRLGFLEKFEDVDGIMDAIAKILAYAGPIGQQPWLDRYFLSKNPIKVQLMRWGFINSYNPIARFAQTRSNERRAEIKNLKANSENPDDVQDTVNGVDFLTRFLLSQKRDPEFMTDFMVLTATVSLINAGSDTTAISLSSVFYFLLKNPWAYERLMKELDEAVTSGKISPHDDIISWPDAQKLPYLDAVIQESFRLFPAVGLLLERHVPPNGAIICGEHIPGGTIVGCNAWVLHNLPEVFGEDVGEFRPERWLEADAAQLKTMKATMFQFGAGSRTCIGRHISTLEVYKMVPTFLRNFTIEWAEPGQDWKTENCWFVRQLDLNVKFKARISEKV